MNSVTGITSFTLFAGDHESPTARCPGNFTTLVHKIHMGKDLVKENYNYANVAFNNKGYSMLGGGQKMCTKCHDNTKAAQADNWKAKPTPAGLRRMPRRHQLGDGQPERPWPTRPKVSARHPVTSARQQPDDATCALCHRAELRSWKTTRPRT